MAKRTIYRIEVIVTTSKKARIRSIVANSLREVKSLLHGLKCGWIVYSNGAHYANNIYTPESFRKAGYLFPVS